MHSHSTTLKPLIEYKFPSNTITVQKPDNTLSHLTIAEYNQFFNVSMSHGVFYDPKHQPLVDELQKKQCLKPSGKEEAVQNYLNNPKTYFAVRYINKTCGYGLAALDDIPKNTVVGIYSAELFFEEIGEEIDEDMDKETRRKQRAYDMTVEDSVELEGKQYHIGLRALYHSDLTRFASHFPSIKGRDNLPLDKTINRKNILTNNIDFSTAVIDGKPFCYYMTTENIKKGKFVGINYGNNYWKNRGKPCIFEKMKEYIKVNYYDGEQKKYTPGTEFINSKLARGKPTHSNPEKKNEPLKKKRKVVHNFSITKPSIAKLSFLTTHNVLQGVQKPLFQRKLGSKRS